MIYQVKPVDNSEASTENKAMRAHEDQVQAGRNRVSSALPLAPEDPVEANGRALGLSENCIRVLRSRYLKKGPDGKCVETPP